MPPTSMLASQQRPAGLRATLTAAVTPSNALFFLALAGLTRFDLWPMGCAPARFRENRGISMERLPRGNCSLRLLIDDDFPFYPQMRWTPVPSAALGPSPAPLPSPAKFVTILDAGDFHPLRPGGTKAMTETIVKGNPAKPHPWKRKRQLGHVTPEAAPAHNLGAEELWFMHRRIIRKAIKFLRYAA